LLHKLTNHPTSERKQELVNTLLENQNARNDNEEHLKNIRSMRNEGAPERELEKLEFSLYGFSSLIDLMLGTSGSAEVSRCNFVKFCTQQSPDKYGIIVSYCIAVLKLLHCQNSDVCYQMMLLILHKYASSKSASGSGSGSGGRACPVSTIFREVATPEQKASVAAFLKFGAHLDLDVFVSSFKVCIRLLKDIYVSYFRSPEGDFLRCSFMNATAEHMYLCTLKIQKQFRSNQAKKKIEAIRKIEDEIEARNRQANEAF